MALKKLGDIKVHVLMCRCFEKATFRKRHRALIGNERMLQRVQTFKF